MGISIDEHIGVIEDLKSTMSVCMPEPEKTEICTSLSEAIDTMRKYQKIESKIKVLRHFTEDTPLATQRMIRIVNEIREVLEDGSENNHHASNT